MYFARSLVPVLLKNGWFSLWSNLRVMKSARVLVITENVTADLIKVLSSCFRKLTWAVTNSRSSLLLLTPEQLLVLWTPSELVV